jgi:hypothetical protein
MVRNTDLEAETGKKIANRSGRNPTSYNATLAEKRFLIRHYLELSTARTKEPMQRRASGNRQTVKKTWRFRRFPIIGIRRLYFACRAGFGWDVRRASCATSLSGPDRNGSLQTRIRPLRIVACGTRGTHVARASRPQQGVPAPVRVARSGWCGVRFGQVSFIVSVALRLIRIRPATKTADHDFRSRGSMQCAFRMICINVTSR